MQRILVMFVVLALLMMALAVPAFAQGPEGGNPGNLLCFQGTTVGANELQPLPFGGRSPKPGLITHQRAWFSLVLGHLTAL